MRIGIPNEIKDHEYRVGATPEMVHALTDGGHSVLVEKQAGHKVGFSDIQYSEAGAQIVDTPTQVFEADLIVKVKEPQPSEYPLLKEGQILFSYLHLAAAKEVAEALIASKAVAIAYETVCDPTGALPLLRPMSEMAGRIATQAGAHALHMAHGGKGVLLGGVPGTAAGKVVIIGGGAVGTQSARMALGLGADVTVLDNNLGRLRELDEVYGPHLKTRFSNATAIREELKQADLLIGAVLVPGRAAPRLVTEEMVQSMEEGSVLVDVAIDQGGCIETSRPTTHSEPTYIEHGIVHYCVTNMPGACARTATRALTNATLPYVLELANHGYKKALAYDLGFLEGLNICLGACTHEGIAAELSCIHTPADELLAG